MDKLFDNIFEKSKIFECIMIHSDISPLLYLYNENIVKKYFFDLFTKLIDNNKTIIIPTFNWDFCQGKEYNYLNTKYQTGILSQWCLESNLFERTNDPIYSCMIAGNNKHIFLNIDYNNAFGVNSIFDKLEYLNTLIIMLNNEHLTIVHYYEEKSNVNYRFLKKFYGKVEFKNKKIENYEYSMYVRSLNINPIHNNCFTKYNNFTSIDKINYFDNFYTFFINLNIFKDEIQNAIHNDNYFLLKNKLEVCLKLKDYKFEKNFIDQDLKSFAKLSGDFNPLHYDREISKNLVFGDWILHGMNGVLTALNFISKNLILNDKIFIKNIQISYHKPIFLNKLIKFKLEFGENILIIRLFDGLKILTEIKICYELNYGFSNLPFKKHVYTIKQPKKNKNYKDYNEILEISGDLEILNSYYPYILNNFYLPQILILSSISRNVGMEYPGFNSICMSITLNFTKKTGDIFFKYNNLQNDILEIEILSEAVKGNVIVNTNRKKKETIYLLSYKNIDFIKKELQYNCKIEYNCKMEYQVKICEYNQLEQDIINKDSNLYKSNPKFIIIINRIEDILKIDFFDIYEEQYEILFDTYLDLIKNLRKNIESTIFINSLTLTIKPLLQNCYSKYSLHYLINKFNNKLYNLSEELIDVNIINSHLFNCNPIDYKSYFIGNYIYSYQYSKKIANFMYGLILNKLGKSIRLIILDLDNTLWKGIVGEDGVNGIEIGETYPGNCFSFFQKVLKSYSKIGIPLAICSKNDEKIVKEVFEQRKEMILKYEDFVCKKINWRNKSENILNISKEIGLGLSNILFIDDNPIEREEVKKILPEINILEIDINKPEDYSNKLLNYNKLVFNDISEEDLQRDTKYKKNLELTTCKINFDDINEFYKSLKSKVYLTNLNDKNIDRCVNLINKTNQFNFTTVRLNKNEILEMNGKNFEFFVIGYGNIYFEYENVGVIIFDNIKNEIFNYLLSCRVIGKGIEEDILIYFINYLKSKKIEKISGKIVETERNIPVRQIYKNLGFVDNNLNYSLNLSIFIRNTKNSEIVFEEFKTGIMLENNLVKNKILEIVKEISEYQPEINEKISEYHDFDSLKTILLIKKIENEFNIIISEEYFNLSISDIICRYKLI